MRSHHLLVHSAAAVCATITFVLNFLTLNALFNKRKTLKQSKAVILVILWHYFFSSVALIHTLYMTLFLLGYARRMDDFVFWSGNFSYSLEASIGVCNLFVAIGRVLVMWKPLTYHKNHSETLQKTTLLTVACVTVFTATAFAVHRTLPPSAPRAFIDYIDIRVVQSLHWFDASVSISNVVITLVFINELRKYLSRTRLALVSYSERTAKINLLVYYQIISEVVIISLPILVTSVYNNAWRTSLPRKIGPYPLTVAALYTAVCSLLFYNKLNV
ncbi:hypothetical protein QR680_009814 [Steinernema hermaphroditum]|uniref:Uncharacterized protein n=1 Tax=Steinernema hermaphroditum TaxID=289476 RepID=A0AA39IN34_9BILA|nr:hypothetical protein QR680_009814 [Steinernema hermaphroditum]